MRSDLRMVVRRLMRSLSVVATVVLSLGFGTGAVVLAYSWYQGLLEAPLPAVPDQHELVTLRSRTVDGFTLTSLPEYRDWRDGTQTLSGLAASSLYLFSVSVSTDPGATPEPVYGMFASANYFPVLGVPVPIGRNFEALDETPGEGLVAIVSDRFWRVRLAASPDVLGRRILINGQEASVIGVAAPRFGGTIAGASFDFWVPLAARTTLVPAEAEPIESRSSRWLDMTGRRRPGASLTQTREEFAVVGTRQAASWVESQGRTIEVGPLDTGVTQQMRPLFVSLLALTAIVLLIVCSNVANILLVRGASDTREIAIRYALGATRARMLAMLMVESTLLAGAGALVGLALAAAGRGALVTLIPTTTIPLDIDVPFDAHMRIFVVVLTSATVVLFGALPAVVTSRVRLTGALADGTRGVTAGRPRIRTTLVALQCALSLTTLIGASLFMRRADAIQTLDPGFSAPDRVLLMQSEAALAGYRDLSRWQTTLDDIKVRVEQVPGVRAATWATFVPLGFVGYARRDIGVEGYAPQAGESMRVLVNGVGDQYFELMGVSILEGRPIVADDAFDRPGVAVVNQTLARRFWPQGAAVGRRLSLGGRTLTVVGVARDGRYDYRAFDEPPGPLIYYALAQSPGRFVTLHARTDGEPLAAAAAIRQAMTAVDPAFVTLAPISLAEYVAGPMTPLRLGSVFLAVLGVAALALSAMGLQAVIAYGIVVRTREIGIRLALGASGIRVVGLFLRQALLMTAVGVVIGLALTAALVPIIGQQLGRVQGFDAGAVRWPVALLVMVAVGASALSARRATRIDPALTLRRE